MERLAGWNSESKNFVLAKVGDEYLYMDGEKIPSPLETTLKITVYIFSFRDGKYSVADENGVFLIEGVEDMRELVEKLTKMEIFSSTVFQMLICSELAKKLSQ